MPWITLFITGLCEGNPLVAGNNTHKGSVISSVGIYLVVLTSWRTQSYIFCAWINSCILTTFVISSSEIMDHPAVLANPIHVCHSLPKFNYIVTTGSSGGLLSRKNNVSCTDGRHVRPVNGIRRKFLCTDMQLRQGWVITWKTMILISSIWYTQLFPFNKRDPSLELCTRFTPCYVLLCLVVV